MPRRKSQPSWRPHDCEDYPHCSCLANINEWLGRIDDDEPYDPEWAVQSSFVSFNCLLWNSPDRSLRRWAKKQLSHPIYDEEHEWARQAERRRALRRYQ